MAGNAAFGTLPGILSTEGKDITTVTAPVCTHIRQRFESMRYPMVEPLLIFSSVRFRYTFSYDLFKTLFVASVFAVLALVAKRVE
jgi:hypothetical protein